MAEADRQLASSESGQRKTEYANLVGFLALALIVGVLFLRDALLDLLGQVVDTFDPQPGA
jgi:Flp pilus assembly pilin Flp